MRRHKYLLWLPAIAILLIGGLGMASHQVQAESRDQEQEQDQRNRDEDPRDTAESEYRYRLQDAKAKFEVLGERVTHWGERASQEWSQYEALVKQQSDDLSRKIDEMKYRAGAEWQQLANEVEQGLKALDDLYYQAETRFKF